MRGLSDPNAGKLSSIRTYLLIALIFNILAVIAWGFLSLFLFIIVFPVIFLVVSIVILSRTNQMRSASEVDELPGVGHRCVAFDRGDKRDFSASRLRDDKRTAATRDGPSGCDT